MQTTLEPGRELTAPRTVPDALALGAVTSVAVAGSVAAIFALPLEETGSLMSDLPLFVVVPIALVTWFTVLLVGGALFGAAVARFLRLPWRRAARSGALAFYLTVVTVEVPVHFTQVFIDPLRAITPWGPHILFGVVFSAEVALVAAVTTRWVLRSLGIDDAWPIARRVGAAGALGFAAATLLAIPLGWKVALGTPMAMVWALHLGNALGAFAAGSALGVTLRGRSVTT